VRFELCGEPNSSFSLAENGLEESGDLGVTFRLELGGSFRHTW